MRLRRPVLLVNAALGLVVLAGAGWGYTLVAGPAEASTTGDANTRTVPVQQGTVTATVTASGSVQSAATATADFVTSGTVTEIRVQVGDRVKKGAVLAKVDDAASQRQLTAAQANLTAAQDALDRAEDADQDTTDAQAQVTQAELDVEEAQAAVDGTTLTAPMAGTVVAVNGTVGGSNGGSNGSSNSNSSNSNSSNSNSDNSTGSSDTSSGFIEIADLTKLEVSATVAEADATRLKAKQAATVTWNALPDTKITGKLASVDPNATTSNNVVQYGITVSLDGRPELARLGQTVQVAITTGQVDDAVYVPSAAVSTAGGRKTVTVSTGTGQQEVRAVEIGLEGDQFTQITSGLEPGEQVVIRMNSSTTTNNPFRNGGVIPGGGAFNGGGGTAPRQGGGR